jgi:hypothetical protein
MNSLDIKYVVKVQTNSFCRNQAHPDMDLRIVRNRSQVPDGERRDGKQPALVLELGIVDAVRPEPLDPGDLQPCGVRPVVGPAHTIRFCIPYSGGPHKFSKS